MLSQSPQNRFVAQAASSLHVGFRHLSASPPALTWTAVPLCSSAVASVNLTNLGPSILSIYSFSTNNLQFRPLSAVPLDIPPYGSVSVSLQYTPSEPRPAFGQLRVRRRRPSSEKGKPPPAPATQRPRRRIPAILRPHCSPSPPANPRPFSSRSRHGLLALNAFFLPSIPLPTQVHTRDSDAVIPLSGYSVASPYQLKPISAVPYLGRLAGLPQRGGSAGAGGSAGDAAAGAVAADASKSARASPDAQAPRRPSVSVGRISLFNPHPRPLRVTGVSILADLFEVVPDASSWLLKPGERRDVAQIFLNATAPGRRARERERTTPRGAASSPLSRSQLWHA